jgi:hypothetical protein
MVVKAAHPRTDHPNPAWSSLGGFRRPRRGALASGFAIAELHHHSGPDPLARTLRHACGSRVHGRRPTERVTTLPHPGHSKVCISEPSWRCQSGSTRAMVISCRHCLQVGKFNAFPSIDGCGCTGLSRSARTSGWG